MCYFLAIGALTESWKLAELLERELRPEVDATSAPAAVLAAFPVDDSVRLVTREGCSCALLDRASRGATLGEVPGGTVQLSSPSRRALAAAVATLGKVRVYVRSRRHRSSEERRVRSITLTELMKPETAVPTHVLIEIVREAPSSSVA
jgi:hypothetical protein